MYTVLHFLLNFAQRPPFRSETGVTAIEYALIASLERFPVWLNRDSHGRRNRGVCGKRFGFERVPWPNPIRRICASAW